MKRIIFGVLFILIILSATVHALEDTTPNYIVIPSSTDITAQQSAVSCAQAAAGISQLTSKVNDLQGSVMTKSDLEAFKQEMQSQYYSQFMDLISKQILVLIVFTLFFFALLLIGKARRWY